MGYPSLQGYDKHKNKYLYFGITILIVSDMQMFCKEIVGDVPAALKVLVVWHLIFIKLNITLFSDQGYTVVLTYNLKLFS